MFILSGKKILLGVIVGIVVYKSVFLVCLLVKKGVEVKVVMIFLVKEFVIFLMFLIFLKNEVLLFFIDEENENV